MQIATPDLGSFRRSEAYLTGADRSARGGARATRFLINDHLSRNSVSARHCAQERGRAAARRTDVVVLGSGAEERNARWAHSRRRYDAGYGVKTFDALSQVIAFFEERRGRLYGFRWRDRLDNSSAAPDAAERRPTRRSAPVTA